LNDLNLDMFCLGHQRSLRMGEICCNWSQ